MRNPIVHMLLVAVVVGIWFTLSEPVKLKLPPSYAKDMANYHERSKENLGTGVKGANGIETVFDSLAEEK